MSKENILFSIIGLLLGFIVGFMFANSANQREMTTASTTPRTPATTAAQKNLPPDHPQIPSNAVADQPDPQGMQAAVQAEIQKARNEPNNFDVQKRAGDLFYQIQRWDEAIDFWLKANKLRPDDYETIVNIGNAYFEAGKYERAEQWYTSALLKNPKDVNVRTDLGTTFMARVPPDFDRAIKEYKRSLETNQNHEQTLHNLVIAYTKKGQAKEARAMLERLEKVNPNNTDIPQMRSQLETLKG